MLILPGPHHISSISTTHRPTSNLCNIQCIIVKLTDVMSHTLIIISNTKQQKFRI